MLSCLEIFIDDQFYEPTPNSPSVHTQLLQFSEALKIAIANIFRAREQNGDHNKEYRGDLPEAKDDGEVIPDILSESLTADSLAIQLTAIDHEELRNVNVRELLDFTKNEMHFLNLQAAQLRKAHLNDADEEDVNDNGSNPHPPRSPKRVEMTPHERHVNTTENRAGWAKGLSSYFLRTRAIQQWVIVDVLTTPTLSQRVQKFRKWIRVAYKLLEHNNFQTCQTLVYAFNHPGIQRMRHFLKEVDCLDSLESLKQAFSEPSSTSIKRFLTSLRNEDKEKTPPIPCLSIWVSDLQLIEEAEPTVLTDNGAGLIHWRKYQAISTIFTQFVNIQNLVVPSTYSKKIHLQNFIQDGINGSRHFDTSKLMGLSNSLEA